MKNLFAIGGPNGAGKTTAIMSLLPHYLECTEFVNADLLAMGLSPFSPGTANLEAARLMLKRMKHLREKGLSFAFETTLSSRHFVNFLEDARRRGYRLYLIYLWLNHVDLAVERVRSRVQTGGHDIPEEVIRRRYYRSLKNLFDLYLPLVDNAHIYNASSAKLTLIAQKIDAEGWNIYNVQEWHNMQEDQL